MRTAAANRCTLIGMVAAIGLAVGLAACDPGSQPTDAGGAVATSPSGTLSAPPKGKPKSKAHKGSTSGQEARVGRVVDGDTLVLSDGRRVRLVQIDTPELGTGECYSRRAAEALGLLTPPGSAITLVRDPALDNIDRYGRLLRYVSRGSLNVNLELVRRGAGSVWFYGGDRGRYAEQLLSAAEKARRDRRGAWGACDAKLDPLNAFTTLPKHDRPHTLVGAGGGCAPGYEPCLPITSDLDCADVEALGAAPVHVTGSDQYGLDGDGDGIGCE